MIPSVFKVIGPSVFNNLGPSVLQFGLASISPDVFNGCGFVSIIPDVFNGGGGFTGLNVISSSSSSSRRVGKIGGGAFNFFGGFSGPSTVIGF